jgi:hypothetical protein
MRCWLRSGSQGAVEDLGEGLAVSHTPVEPVDGKQPGIAGELDRRWLVHEQRTEEN